MTTQPTGYEKPLPVLDGLTGEFYGWLQKQELRFQRCTNCGTLRHIPWPMCRNCNSMNWEWMKSSGKGKVHTWIVTHQAFTRGFKDETPYNTAIVELEEGPRVMTHVTDIPSSDLKLDMPVEIWFEDVTPEVTLHRFRPIKK